MVWPVRDAWVWLNLACSPFHLFSFQVEKQCQYASQIGEYYRHTTAPACVISTLVQIYTSSCYINIVISVLTY